MSGDPLSVNTQRTAMIWSRHLTLLLVAVLVASVSRTSSTAADHLFIYHLNVGQGDATLVVAPGGKTLLVDAGNNGKGDAVVVPVLRKLGISALDFIVATHYDADHIGGLDEVIASTGSSAGSVLDRGAEPARETQTFRNYVDQAGTRRLTIEPGQTIDVGTDVEVKCVAVNGRTADGGVVALRAGDENDASVALTIRFRKFDYFLGGDLTGGGRSGSRRTSDVESRVAHLVGNVDVLRLNHHGSTTSSNDLFLKTLDPEVVVISVGNGGVNRGYQHPSRDVLDRVLSQRTVEAVFLTERGETDGGLTDADLKIVRVADCNVAVWTDGNSYVVNGMIFKTR